MKVLIIRFSSFGDVLQTLSVAGRITEVHPQAKIHWVTRDEFVPLVSSHPSVRKVWSVPKGAGFKELWALGGQLKAEGFTHVYDAHNNLRSHILSLRLNGFAAWRVWTGKQKFLRRSIYRWKRFLLFRFRKNLFPKPFSGQSALLEPLTKWGIASQLPATPQLYLDSDSVFKLKSRFGGKAVVALAPSASYPLKRWPVEYWKQLILSCPETIFVLLGGPEDVFLTELAQVDTKRVVNMAGKLSLLESACVVAASKVLVSNDTGLLHVAEQLGKPCLALMGPAPFGFPSRPKTQIFEIDLACRPCSKHGQGPCVNPEYQKCMRDIKPENVARSLRSLLYAPVGTPVSEP
ncbi:MAG: glycosyltransferase family 9 protein [Bdellovibrionales bacterium]